MSKTDKIELSERTVRAFAFAGDTRPNEWEHARDEARAALAEWEKKQSPLGLPWTKTLDSGNSVVDCRDLHVPCNEAQAKLIAAAPELAKLVAEIDADPNNNLTIGHADEARELLAKIGWGEYG